MDIIRIPKITREIRTKGKPSGMTQSFRNLHMTYVTLLHSYALMHSITVLSFVVIIVLMCIAICLLQL